MSDGEDFWGDEPSSTGAALKTSKKIVSTSQSETPSRKPSRSQSPAASSIGSESEKSQDSGSDYDGNGSNKSRSSGSSGSRRKSSKKDSEGSSHSGSGGSESDRTEDDPLSDVWDSGDEESESDASGDQDGQDHERFNHEFATIKTPKGHIEIDITKPPILLEEAKYLRGKAYRQRSSDDAIKQSCRCLALSRIIYEDCGHWEMAAAESWIAKVYWELKEYPLQTHQHAVLASQLLIRGEMEGRPKSLPPPPEKTDILDTVLLTYYMLGKSLMAMKKYTESESALLKAQKALEQRKQAAAMKLGAFWTTELSTAMARIKVCQEKPDEAMPYLEKVEKLMGKRYGNDSVKLISLYKEMEKVEESRPDRDGNDMALEYAIRVYSITKSNVEDGDVKKNKIELAHAAKSLAMAYQRVGTEEGEIYTESYLNEAITLYQETLGNINSHGLRAQELLARFLSEKGRSQEAVALYQPLIGRYEKNAGKISMKVANARRVLAGFHLQNENTRDAASQLKRVVEIESSVLGGSNAKTQSTQKALSVLLKNPQLEDLRADAKLGDRPRFKNAIKTVSLISTGLSKHVPDDI